MNIDLECPTCQSILRVSNEHAGKQLRCPNCGSITTIPSADAGPLPDVDGIPTADRVFESAPARDHNPVDRVGYDDLLQRYDSDRVEIREDNSPEVAPTQYDPNYRSSYHAGYQQPPPGGYPPGAPQQPPVYPNTPYQNPPYPQGTPGQPYQQPTGFHKRNGNSPASVIFGVLGMFSLFSCLCPAPILFIAGLANANKCSGGLQVFSYVLNFGGLTMFCFRIMAAFVFRF